MNINFALIIVILTVLSGVIALADYLFWQRKREARSAKMPWWIDYSRAFFPVFLAVLIIRSFIFQFYYVPSGSLMPTVLPGDLVFVTQYSYGLRLPLTKTKILSIGEPKRGDIALFYPPDPKVTYIKRIVGVPGDHIIYKNRTLSINDKIATQKVVGEMTYHSLPPEAQRTFAAQIVEEDLAGVQHKILLEKDRSSDSVVYDFVVPPGYYFAMGDNRDDSGDSRYWGLVPERDLIGQAWWVVIGWDLHHHHHIRWSRIGTRIAPQR
ncbi:MAG: signal peptidase I [Gammaproteobacteria bacterium]|nr:signal peptidase I [Gammaproteobacteria bacterium]